MSSDLLTVRDLRARRGDFLLDVPDWRVPAGCVVGVVGPNGAGKTTLLRTLPGLDAPDGGEIRVLGRDPRREVVAVRNLMGFMSDDMPVFNLRIDKLLRMISGYYPTWNPDLVDLLVERFELPLNKRPAALSKGQGTRLRLLLAMAFEPRLLVLDEPATGLDLSGRRSLLESVLEIVRDAGRSVVVSSHNLTDLERIADRLLVMDGGEVVREGPTDSLVGDGRTLEEALLAWGAA